MSRKNTSTSNENIILSEVTSDSFTREQALNAVPVRNEAVNTQYGDNEEAILTFYVQQRGWLVSMLRFLGKPDTISMQKRLQLDEIGTLIWQLSDGKTSVLDMIDLLCDRYRLHRKEAEKSLLAFLRMLGERGLIAMELKSLHGS
ncbi:MAG: PqqD family protein [Deltaproteobacteria bacterium]|nr:PqqD family protein [Deltaproteobacteria bacterium]